MLRIRTGAPGGLRWGVFGFASVVAFLTLSSDLATAAPYAAIVVDGNSGAVLHSSNPDAQRHPASLTKIMTLYLLFEQLEAGKLKLDSQLKVSEHAASQSPTKLGLRAGSTIAVEDAIKGIITRSANDAAVVVAEAIAGDEDDFAKLMTRKAVTLGMSRTVYKNASGLPDDNQVTTARDQSTLGRAIQERFPRYYKYFSTRSFTFRGQGIANHNRLLGRIDGVDGIKTGYIRASGFNLVTSVNRGNRYVVAVVMGGSSAGSRDARMRELISEHIAHASTKRTTSMVAEAERPELKAEPKVAVQAEAKPEPKAAAKPTTGGERHQRAGSLRAGTQGGGGRAARRADRRRERGSGRHRLDRAHSSGSGQDSDRQSKPADRIAGRAQCALARRRGRADHASRRTRPGQRTRSRKPSRRAREGRSSGQSRRTASAAARRPPGRARHVTGAPRSSAHGRGRTDTRANAGARLRGHPGPSARACRGRRRGRRRRGKAAGSQRLYHPGRCLSGRGGRQATPEHGAKQGRQAGGRRRPLQ